MKPRKISVRKRMLVVLSRISLKLVLGGSLLVDRAQAAGFMQEWATGRRNSPWERQRRAMAMIKMPKQIPSKNKAYSKPMTALAWVTIVLGANQKIKISLLLSSPLLEWQSPSLRFSLIKLPN